MVDFGGEEKKDFNSSCFGIFTCFFLVLVTWREFWWVELGKKMVLVWDYFFK